MFRNVNPAAAKSRWYLSSSWEVSYEYQTRRRGGTSGRKSLKKMGAASQMSFTKKGTLGEETDLPLLAIAMTKDSKRTPPMVFQPHLLVTAKSWDPQQRGNIVRLRQTPAQLGRKFFVWFLVLFRCHQHSDVF